MIIVVGSVCLVIGVLLTLHFIGKRPININIDAHAEAHGGSAYASPSNAPSGGGVSGAIAGLIKVAAIVGVSILALATVGNLLAQRSAPDRIVINMPTQQAPKVIVTVQAPVINVKPEAPIVNVPVSTSPLESVVLIISGLASLITIAVSVAIIRSLKAQNILRDQYGNEFQRTKPQGAIVADDVAPGLFKQKVVRK